ncbi:MAG TPA: nucleotidyltransferase family protein, partial [Methylocella sp.]|nr:nucleotidyltransferase family protein [Methylocella sp.]
MMVDKGVFAKRLLEFASSSLILDMALAQAQSRKLKNWWIVGGAVRDAVWCLIEGRDQASLIQDIDLLYFDSSDLSEEKDGDIEASLKPIEGIPWSVKNQARMHIKSNDAPYSSLQEALYCAPD